MLGSSLPPVGNEKINIPENWKYWVHDASHRTKTNKTKNTPLYASEHK
jgi:hypothetical protein